MGDETTVFDVEEFTRLRGLAKLAWPLDRNAGKRLHALLEAIGVTHPRALKALRAALRALAGKDD